MKYLINIIILIACLLASIAFFLFVYNKIGFYFTVSCLFYWSWSIGCYGVVIWLVKTLKEDL